MKPLPVLLILCAAFAAAFRAGSAADEGHSQPLAGFRRVVIADDALPVQQEAARELAHFAGRIAGVDIEVQHWSQYRQAMGDGLSFFVGEGAASKALGTELAPWKHEEWLVKSLPGGLALAGHDGTGDPWSSSTPAGSMLAAYTLLDDYLGVRWFWPGEFGEHIPYEPQARIPLLNVRRVPAWEIRFVDIGYPHSYHTPAFATACRRWTRRNRLAWTRSAVFGHSWYDAFNLRNDDTFKAHPDWFALVDGERRPPQMCTTHPAVIDRMVEHVLNGKQEIMHISPSDGGGFCECERCRARRAGHPQLRRPDDPVERPHLHLRQRDRPPCPRARSGQGLRHVRLHVL